jgi:CBS domain-containing protein
MLKARHLMNSCIEYVKEDETVREVASLLATKDIGAVPVFDKDGYLAGMITDRDIAVRVVAAGKDPDLPVSEILGSGEIVAVGADDPVEEVLITMSEHQVRRILVTDGTDVIGIISQADLARQIASDQVGYLLADISSGRGPADPVVVDLGALTA